MTTLAVDPAALDGAGVAVISAGEGLQAVVSALLSALAGCAGMAGDDPAGAAFGRGYDGSAAKVVEAMATARNALCGLGDGIRVSAHNYSVAEAMSDVSGRGDPLPAPALSTGFSAGSLPSSVGASSSAPPGWGWVAPDVGMIWPSGDSARLRAAAQAWTAAGNKFALGELLDTGAPMEVVRAQDIPEDAAIEAALSDVCGSTTSLVQQCSSVAEQLTGYAGAIDAVHAAILDLLARICDPLTGIKEVWDVLTGEDEDEIRRIANDIRTVVVHFAAEVSALGAQIAGVTAEAGRVIATMSSYAARQWDQFLHHSDVGCNVDTAGQYFKGIGLEAGGMLKGLWEISQPRALIDPLGFHHSMRDMVGGALPLVGLGGDHAPSVEESWKQLGRSLSHWDEFQSNPAEAVGRSVFDLGTLALPGGPLSKLGKAGRSAADALKGLKKPPPFEAPRGAPPIERPIPAPKEPPPVTKPPAPGNQAPLPTAKPRPGSAPLTQKLPHGPTEPKIEAPKPSITPSQSAPHHPPPSTASLGEHPASTIGQGVHPPQSELPATAQATPTTPTASAPQPHTPTTAPRADVDTQNDTLATEGDDNHQPPANGGADHGSSDDPSLHAGDLSALTPNDLAAIRDYTGYGYIDMNSALRSGVLDADQQARVNSLNDALAKLPEYHGTVVRGTNVPPELLADYRPGEFIIEDGFFSATRDRGVAQSPTFAGNVEFRIISSRGRDVSAISLHPGEQEVLFPAGTRFYVVDKYRDPVTGRTTIEMIER